LNYFKNNETGEVLSHKAVFRCDAKNRGQWECDYVFNYVGNRPEVTNELSEEAQCFLGFAWMLAIGP